MEKKKKASPGLCMLFGVSPDQIEKAIDKMNAFQAGLIEFQKRERQPENENEKENE